LDATPRKLAVEHVDTRVLGGQQQVRDAAAGLHVPVLECRERGSLPVDIAHVSGEANIVSRITHDTEVTPSRAHHVLFAEVGWRGKKLDPMHGSERS